MVLSMCLLAALSSWLFLVTLHLLTLLTVRVWLRYLSEAIGIRMQ